MDRYSLLIVDDETEVLEVLSDVFNREYDITLARDAKTAVEQFQSVSPDIVIVDLAMPGESGLSLLKKIKEIDVDAVVVVFTGFGDKYSAIESMRNGAFDFVEKPFDYEIFDATLTRATGGLASKQLTQNQFVNRDRLAEIGELTAEIAHEIFNPLTVISGRAHVMKRHLMSGKVDSQKFTELASSIISMCNRITAITTAVKNFAYGDHSQDFGHWSLEEIFQDALGLCQFRIDRGQVDFSSSIPDHSLKLYCHRVALSQVIVNLVNNAVYAVRGQGVRKVLISATSDGELLRLVVADSGRGVPIENYSRIFESSFTTKPTGEGTGLGLNICRNIVHRHRGKISVGESDLGGAAFTVSLPMTGVG